VDLYEQALENLRKSTLETRISRAVEIIEQRIGDKNFGLADICNELYLSVSQFSLIFKEGTGKTFLEYLTERRIEAAKKLLKSSDMKGYKIAEAVGFSDPRYFSIVFKKHCGMTAMQYRSSRSE
jgi:two-component system response regulator YesN